MNYEVVIGESTCFLGKDLQGYKFLFNYSRGWRSVSDVKKFVKSKKGKIVDETEKEVSLKDFLKLIKLRQKEGKSNKEAIHKDKGGYEFFYFE